jgi:hypothetical protein
MAKKDKKTTVKDKESSSSEVTRKFKANPVLYVGSIFILVLVTIAFLAGDFLGGRMGGGNVADSTFGFYDRVPISWIPGNIFFEYQDQAYRRYLAQAQAQGIETETLDAFTEFQIFQQAFHATVVHTAIMQMLNRSNYSVPERTVDRHVAQLPHFQENGRFSSTLYQQMPESRRLALWRQVHDELARNMIYSDYFFGGLLIPSGEAEFITNLASSMRSFEMVAIRVDNYPESEYLAYAQQNSDLFRTIHLSRITAGSNEREARRIIDSIQSGAITFEDAARSQSQDHLSDRGGDMGSRFVFELQAEIPSSSDRENIFRLRRGEISDAIRIGGNWAFFRIEEELAQADFENEATMERVRSYVRNFDRGRMEDWAIAQALEFIAEAEAESFEDAARWRNLDRHTFGPLPLNFGSIELFTALESFSMPGFPAQDLQGLSRNENFWRIAFSTELNTPSQPLVQGNNVLVFLPVEQIETEDIVLDNMVFMYNSYWLNMITEMSFPSYFLNNHRMDNRFIETYFGN